jgi:hypothetical protein
VRETVDRVHAFDEVLSLYEEVIGEHAAAARDAAEEGRAAARYLRWAMSGATAERDEFFNSAAGRLRQWAVEAPLLGPLMRGVGRRMRGAKGVGRG